MIRRDREKVRKEEQPKKQKRKWQDYYDRFLCILDCDMWRGTRQWSGCRMSLEKKIKYCNRCCETCEERMNEILNSILNHELDDIINRNVEEKPRKVERPRKRKRRFWDYYGQILCMLECDLWRGGEDLEECEKGIWNKLKYCNRCYDITEEKISEVFRAAIVHKESDVKGNKKS